MLGIESIGIYIAKNKIKCSSLSQIYDVDEAFITDKLGIEELPRKEKEQDTSDLAVLAVKNLVEKTELKLEEVEIICLVTQNGDNYQLPHTSAIIQSKLGIKSTKVACFDISLGCSGYVYGLTVIKSMMKELNMKRGILITSDPYSKILNENDRNTNMLFGDAATATLISENFIFSINKPLLETKGTDWENLFTDDKRKLVMNGRQVFNFATKEATKQINEYLAINNVEIKEIDKIILHQGSGGIIESIKRQFKGEEEKFIKDISKTGNTVSSSIPIILQKILKDKDVKKVIISGFGVGLSWATNLIERRK